MGMRYTKRNWELTREGADGLQVAGVAVLELDGVRTLTTRPSQGEGGAGDDVEIAVGESNLGADHSSEEGERGDGRLHFVW